MTLLGRLRRRQAQAARWITALFAVSWLGLALQPCSAMAAHAESGSAPDAAVAGEAAHDCPHCPPPADPVDEPPCGNALSCDAVGAPALPSKAADLQSVDSAVLVALPCVRVGATGPAADPPPVAGACERRTPSHSAQQRFCSFLK